MIARWRSRTCSIGSASVLRPYRKLHPRRALSHSLSRVDFAAILSLGADALIFRHAGCDGPSSLTNKMREYDKAVELDPKLAAAYT